MKNVIVVIGAGSIGQAIARRVSAGSMSCWPRTCGRETPDSAAKVLSDAGFDVSTATVDVASHTSVHALIDTVSAKGE